MKLVAFKDPYGNYVHINPEHIVSIRPPRVGEYVDGVYAVISLGVRELGVGEMVDDVVARLK